MGLGQIFVICLTAFTTIIFKIAHFIGDYYDKRTRGKTRFWTIVDVINDSLANGWVWFDFFVTIAGIILGIWYILFYRAHRDLKNDFEANEDLAFNSLLPSSGLYTGCTNSEEQAPVRINFSSLQMSFFSFFLFR